MREIQVTLVSTKGYRPVSCIIQVPSISQYAANKSKYQLQAVQKMCAKRHWTARDLTAYGYTGIKARVYDPEKIAAENAARYEQIKRERGWLKDDKETMD